MARILTIDDDAAVQHLLRQIVEHAGYEVVEVRDGREGIAQHRAAPTDLIIMELFIPKHEGLETIRQLRQEFPAIKIIATSGSGRTGTLDFLYVAEKFGASRILRKPIDFQELRDIVRELLESPWPGAQQCPVIPCSLPPDTGGEFIPQACSLDIGRWCIRGSSIRI
jgi:CheY-like chemotaxis protein